MFGLSKAQIAAFALLFTALIVAAVGAGWTIDDSMFSNGHPGDPIPVLYWIAMIIGALSVGLLTGDYLASQEQTKEPKRVPMSRSIPYLQGFKVPNPERG